MRQIIEIDEELCIGCGLCASACHESAIQIIDGKAKLIREDYCDGLGNCLSECPTDAISFIEKEAPAYNPEAVAKHKETLLGCGCPGSMAETFDRKEKESTEGDIQSRLNQWPVQIKLIPANAGYFNGADVLVAADCTAFAYGNFHRDFMDGKISLIGCPKLDDGDYTDKLTEILKINNIKSLTLARMEVPCCGGLECAARQAVENSGKNIPLDIKVISTNGEIR